MPIKPMLLTLVEKPFNDEGFLFEIKYDGVRMLLYKTDNNTFLYNRNLAEKTKNYPELLKNNIPDGTVLDGEIIVQNNEKHDFKAVLERDLVKNFKQNNIVIKYIIFDILWFKGENLMHQPLIKRKEFLKQIDGNEFIVHSDFVIGKGIKLFEKAKRLELEGIIAKKINSKYIPNFRTKDWQKIKVLQTKTVLIGGVKYNKRPSFAVGEFDEDNNFNFLGFVGNGLSNSDGEQVYRALKIIENKSNPFYKNNPNVDFFVEPIIKLEVKFLEITNNGCLRHPIIERIISNGN